MLIGTAGVLALVTTGVGVTGDAGGTGGAVVDATGVLAGGALLH